MEQKYLQKCNLKVILEQGSVYHKIVKSSVSSVIPATRITASIRLLMIWHGGRSSWEILNPPRNACVMVGFFSRSRLYNELNSSYTPLGVGTQLLAIGNVDPRNITLKAPK